MSPPRTTLHRAALRPRRVSRPMVLEPRFMFDGALALDVVVGCRDNFVYCLRATLPEGGAE